MYEKAGMNPLTGKVEIDYMNINVQNKLEMMHDSVVCNGVSFDNLANSLYRKTLEH